MKFELVRVVPLFLLIVSVPLIFWNMYLMLYKDKTADEYNTNKFCKSYTEGFSRCENDEVVCYFISTNHTSLSCVPKIKN